MEFSLVDQTETIVTCVPRSTNHDGVLGLRQPRRCVLYILLSVYSEDNRTHLWVVSFLWPAQHTPFLPQHRPYGKHKHKSRHRRSKKAANAVVWIWMRRVRGVEKRGHMIKKKSLKINTQNKTVEKTEKNSFNILNNPIHIPIKTRYLVAIYFYYLGMT